MAEPGYNLLATPLVVRFSQTPQTTDRKIIVFYTFFSKSEIIGAGTS